tara:strand:- start:11 stop:658 length:648 start_codon:yes stop_codon:yes gene_type:complete
MDDGEQVAPLIRLADHERLQAEAERLQAAHEAECAEDKARIKLLEEQRDAFTMHKLASRQCIGIPASVGVCEPVEGFADRPQDLAPAMREMALIIEADKARIEGLEDKAEELDRLLQEALMAFDIICPECRKQWLLRHCGELPVTDKDERISAQQWLLEQCQQSLRENSETYVELDAYLRGDIDHIEVLAIKAEHEAALAQQGGGVTAWGLLQRR